jgi:hypothetical protein
MKRKKATKRALQYRMAGTPKRSSKRQTNIDKLLKMTVTNDKMKVKLTHTTNHRRKNVFTALIHFPIPELVRVR